MSAEHGDQRARMADGTDCANLLRAYVRTWPLDIGGSADGASFGFKFHTQSQRNSDLEHRHGFEVSDGMRPKEGGAWKWQLASRKVFLEARRQVLSWDTGIPLEELRSEVVSSDGSRQTSLI